LGKDREIFHLSHSNHSQPKIKCVIVGDSTVGKTSCLISYTTNTFPSEFVPTTMDNHTARVMLDDEPAAVEIWDTNGTDGMDRLRPLSYPGTDVFLIAFNIISPYSFTSVRSKWLVELKQHMPTAPILLVGMKADLRTDEEMINLLAEKGIDMITPEAAVKCAEEIGATGYYECSALTQEGLKPLFDDAIRAGRIKKASGPKKKSCMIL
jgi:small GTP-binding protein